MGAGSVFISYRRAENARDARAIYERLVREFGADQVFMDVNGIDLGADFVEVLNKQLEDSKALLALVGSDWLTEKDARGQRRIEDPLDFVHLEVKAALERRIPIVPVLLGGTAPLRPKSFQDHFSRSPGARLFNLTTADSTPISTICARC